MSDIHVNEDDQIVIPEKKFSIPNISRKTAFALGAGAASAVAVVVAFAASKRDEENETFDSRDVIVLADNVDIVPSDPTE